MPSCFSEKTLFKQDSSVSTERTIEKGKEKQIKINGHSFLRKKKDQ